MPKIRNISTKEKEMTMTAATIEKTEATVRYRKNKQDAWVLFGPSSLVVEGPVTVTLKNGKTSVAIVQGIGKAFLVDGVEFRYGYLEPKPAAQEPAPAAAPSPKLSEADFMPDDFVPGDDIGDPADWE